MRTMRGEGFIVGLLDVKLFLRNRTQRVFTNLPTMMTTLPAIEGPPYVGALLRMCLQRARARMQAAARGAGFTDLQDAHWAMITYPVAPGVRPSELARRAGMSRQAANHLIAQLESLGYFERRSPEGAARRLVFLTPRGEALAVAFQACLRELHAERDFATRQGQHCAIDARLDASAAPARGDERHRKDAKNAERACTRGGEPSHSRGAFRIAGARAPHRRERIPPEGRRLNLGLGGRLRPIVRAP